MSGDRKKVELKIGIQAGVDEINPKLENPKMTHNVVRVIGPVTHIRRGTERRDRIKLNERVLTGSVRKQDGKVTETTNYKNRYVEGYNWVWLARRNSRTVKVEDEVPATELIRTPKPIKMAKKPKAPKLTKLEILTKVSNGEMKPGIAADLLKDAA